MAKKEPKKTIQQVDVTKRLGEGQRTRITVDPEKSRTVTSKELNNERAAAEKSYSERVGRGKKTTPVALDTTKKNTPNTPAAKLGKDVGKDVGNPRNVATGPLTYRNEAKTRVTLGKPGTVGGRLIGKGTKAVEQIVNADDRDKGREASFPKKSKPNRNTAPMRTKRGPEYLNTARPAKPDSLQGMPSDYNDADSSSKKFEPRFIEGGRNNKRFTEPHVEKAATGGTQTHLNAMRKHVVDFVSAGGKGPKAEAARTAYHAIKATAGKHVGSADEGICSTPSCTRTTETGNDSCPGGSCNISTSTTPALRNRE